MVFIAFPEGCPFFVLYSGHGFASRAAIRIEFSLWIHGKEHGFSILLQIDPQNIGTLLGRINPGNLVEENAFHSPIWAYSAGRGNSLDPEAAVLCGCCLGAGMVAVRLQDDVFAIDLDPEIFWRARAVMVLKGSAAKPVPALFVADGLWLGQVGV